MPDAAIPHAARGRSGHARAGGHRDVAHARAAAADLVICQTGCISHDTYWRVKGHCKRHRKRCVFVDTPSRSAFERALTQAAADEGMQTQA